MAFKTRLTHAAVKEQQCAPFCLQQILAEASAPCNLDNGTDPIAITTLPKPSHYTHARYRIYAGLVAPAIEIPALFLEAPDKNRLEDR